MASPSSSHPEPRPLPDDGPRGDDDATLPTQTPDPVAEGAPPLPPGPEEPDVALRRGPVIGDGLAWAARWSGRTILVAIVLVVLGLLVGQLWSIVLPVALALVVASVLDSPVRLLERRLRFPTALAAATVLVGGIAIVAAIGFVIAPSVASEWDDILESASGGVQALQDYVQDSNFVTQDQIDSGLQAVQDRLQANGGALASGLLSGFAQAGSFLVTLVVTLILVFLFLKDGRKFRPLVRRMAGEPAGRHLAEVLGRSWKTLGGYIRTQALVSLIDAVLIGAGLLIVGVPLAIPLAVLTFAAGFIPIVGAFVAGGLAVLVALVTNGPTAALIILAVIVGVQQLEGNVLSPWLQAKSMQLHSAVVLLAVTLGSTLFGITGAFLAVPVAAVGAVIVRYLDQCVTEAARARCASGPDGDGPDGAGSTPAAGATHGATTPHD